MTCQSKKFNNIPLSSPHPWGCFYRSLYRGRCILVFPTPVGVFLGLFSCLPSRVGLPHTRGGVSTTVTHVAEEYLSSPHPWGCFSSAPQNPLRSNVFPTPVGVFLKQSPLYPWLQSLPHTRGGVSLHPQQVQETHQSSPHPWGCFYERHTLDAWMLVFPTPVGVFLISNATPCSNLSLPHTRGGVSGFFGNPSIHGWSSPHPWGCF